MTEDRECPLGRGGAGYYCQFCPADNGCTGATVSASAAPYAERSRTTPPSATSTLKQSTC